MKTSAVNHHFDIHIRIEISQIPFGSFNLLRCSAQLIIVGKEELKGNLIATRK